MKHRDFLIFAIPNGGTRNLIEAAYMKKQGVTPGVPDLQILMPNDMVFVEMKRSKGGRVSAEQKGFIDKSTLLGHVVIIGYGCHDAIKKLELYLKDKK